MRLDVVSKASGNQGISPIEFSQIDGLLQSVEVAVAKLQYGAPDSLQEFGIFREVWTAFVGQQRGDEFDLIWPEQYGDALYDSGRQWSPHFFILRAQQCRPHTSHQFQRFCLKRAHESRPATVNLEYV